MKCNRHIHGKEQFQKEANGRVMELSHKKYIRPRRPPERVYGTRVVSASRSTVRVDQLVNIRRNLQETYKSICFWPQFCAERGVIRTSVQYPR